MRLNKYLARTGIGSRRNCDKYIANGEIKINNKTIFDFSYHVNKEDHVKFRNKTINIVEEDFFYIINKPINYICTANDELNRKQILDLIPIKVRLFTIGRLDYKTTGIILLTNNGDVANKLLLPKNKIIKKYYAESDGKFSINQLKKINKGIKIHNIIYNATITFENKNNKVGTYIWNVILNQGKNREIHNIFNHFNINILRLHRYEFAGVNVGNLKSGKYRKLKKNEVFKIKKIFF